MTELLPDENEYNEYNELMRALDDVGEGAVAPPEDDSDDPDLGDAGNGASAHVNPEAPTPHEQEIHIGLGGAALGSSIEGLDTSLAIAARTGQEQAGLLGSDSPHNV